MKSSGDSLHTGSRYAAVDALRGLIMIVMAIDHANAFIARHHSMEFWNGAISIYSGVFPFLTRWITHLCAPGFFFLMGAGIYWFVIARRASGWTQAQTIRRTALRGLAIFLTGQFLENPILFLQSFLTGPVVSLSRVTMAPPNDGTQLYWGFITLSGLGAVMASLVAAPLDVARRQRPLRLCHQFAAPGLRQDRTALGDDGARARNLAAHYRDVPASSVAGRSGAWHVVRLLVEG